MAKPPQKAPRMKAIKEHGKAATLAGTSGIAQTPPETLRQRLGAK